MVIGFDNGAGKGSARSIRGFHLVEGFRRCAEHLEKFGGHEYAGGLSIRAEKLEPFAEAFESVARQTLRADDLSPLVEIDAILRFSQVGFSLARELEILKPFGIGNPEPLFMTPQAEVRERKVFPAGVRYRLRDDGCTLSAVVFGAGDDYPGMPGEKIDVAYRLSENEWNGSSAVELRIVDARPASAGSL